MKILDPLSGETIDTDTWDQTNLSILPNLRETQNRMLSRGLYDSAVGERMKSFRASRAWDDNELGRMIQSDPGDEA